LDVAPPLTSLDHTCAKSLRGTSTSPSLPYPLFPAPTAFETSDIFSSLDSFGFGQPDPPLFRFTSNPPSPISLPPMPGHFTCSQFCYDCVNSRTISQDSECLCCDIFFGEPFRDLKDADPSLQEPCVNALTPRCVFSMRVPASLR